MPVVHIIHDKKRVDRFKLLMDETIQHGLLIQLWDAVKHQSPKTGVSLAHKQIVRYAKEQGLEEVIIAEDDFHFTAPNAFQFFLSKKPKDFDLYLAGVSHGVLDKAGVVKQFTGLWFYIVHNRFYDKFLAADEHFDLDWALEGLGKFVVCNPFACILHETVSDKSGKIHKNAKLFQGRTLYNGS